MKQYVIIGGGIAAVGCMEGIRARDPVSPITLVSAETRPPYCRPLISYYLAGRTDLEKMAYRSAEFYEKNGCRVLCGQRALSLDAERRLVTLENGETLPYTALCLATGSVPFVPPFEGLERVKNAVCFLTAEDALRIESMLRPEAKVLILGAGFIGLKCAEGVRDRVGSVTVCDLADHILPSMLDAEGGAIMQRHLEENGIRFFLGDSVARFEPTAAEMRSGARVDFDLLVLALGVRPETALYRSAGGAAQRGIPVNARMETALCDVYAAGDCVECVDVSCGAVCSMANLPNASMQGRCAGTNMAGGAAAFDRGTRMNSIGFYGLHVMSAGTRDESAEVYAVRGENSLKKLYVRDDRLIGYLLLGDVERAGIYTALIREQRSLSSFDFEAMKQLPSLSPFPAGVRKQLLGGVV